MCSHSLQTTEKSDGLLPPIKDLNVCPWPAYTRHLITADFDAFYWEHYLMPNLLLIDHLAKSRALHLFSLFFTLYLHLILYCSWERPTDRKIHGFSWILRNYFVYVNHVFLNIVSKFYQIYYGPNGCCAAMDRVDAMELRCLRVRKEGMVAGCCILGSFYALMWIDKNKSRVT